MPFITAGSADNPVRLHYTDLGSGPTTLVLIHGWPAAYPMWEYQLNELPRHGVRVVAYTRRGFGQSDQPWEGYDYDTMADDLKAVLDELDLQNVVLVGFSMGGGEAARYMSRHGGARVKKVVFVSAVTPYMLQTADNPDGAPQETYEQMMDGLLQSRPDFLQPFGKQFFGVGMVSHPVSEAVLDWMQHLCLQASPRATEACARAFWETDFRPDMASLRNVPTLFIHGTSDETVPPEVSADRAAPMVPHAQYLRYEGAPHGLFYTDHERLSKDLFVFATTA